MADQPSLFEPNPAGTPPANPAPDNTYANLLGTILNEQGVPKYASVDEALKGAAHAQAYIKQLKDEKAAADLRIAELAIKQDRQAELERTLMELTAKVNNPVTPTSNAPSAESIAELVNKSLDQRTAGERSKANQKAVVDTLVAKYGTDAEVKYNAAAQELGLTVAEMNEFAAKSPKAVLTALGLAAQPAPQSNTFAPASNVINPAAFQPHKESFVKRNSEPVQLGATTEDLTLESRRSRAMVEEIHAAGLSVHDLSDPKTYNKYFGK